MKITEITNADDGSIELLFEILIFQMKAIGSDIKPIQIKASVINSLKKVSFVDSEIIMNIGNGGAFPDWKRPSVAWIGFENDEALGYVAGKIDSILHENIGSPLEKRGFRSHLTVARIKGRLRFDRLRETVERAALDLESAGYSIKIDGVNLYSSSLTREGLVYDTLFTLPFE